MMKYSTVFILLFFLYGCDQGLDLIPKSNISDAIFWNTEDDFKLAANNLYNSLPGLDRDDLNSDIAFADPNSISNGTYQIVNNSSNWNSPYTYIRQSNTIINNAENSENSQDFLRFVGEAKFFRAFNYWKLFRIYGGVPLISEVLDIDDEELYSSRASRKETYDFIIEDLIEASQNLPLQSQLSSEDIGRVTSGAASALLARIALFEGTWNKYHNISQGQDHFELALDYARKVINSGEYSLFNEYGDQSYRYLFIEEGDDSSESILARRYQRNIAGHSFPFSIDQNGYLPTKKLADMYLCSDGLPIDKSELFQGYGSMTSEYENRDPRMTMTMIIPGQETIRPFNQKEPIINYPFYPQKNGNTGYIVYKYISESGNDLPASGNSHEYDKHLIRYAEVLLIYAEALYELNGSISDEELNNTINMLRQRVNMPSISNAMIAEHGLNMLDEIRRERTIELALEGFRYDDLRRWKTAEIELPKAIKGINIRISDWMQPTFEDGIKNLYIEDTWQNKVDENGFIVSEDENLRIFDPNRHYLFPIPTKEILINSNLEQNPGW